MSAARRELARVAGNVAACVACPRLAAYVAGFRTDPAYWARPVPGFGDPEARLLVFGLAPGAHGANRTGRPFTGDGAGVFLYRALHEAGLATAAVATGRDDGLALRDAFVTNAVKCAPPSNLPRPDEVARCSAHLDAELEALRGIRAVLALGRVAHDAWLRREARRRPGLRLKDFPFAHGAVHRPAPDAPAVVDSFHPSRYNVNVGVLTWPMFLAAMRAAAALAAPPGPTSSSGQFRGSKR
ncbi:MAG TPA: uracil-DNA glycosylase [Planctomycetota bacterium]|nr:uracil-DNA glycosylase [Planctomycetota bacterium]